MRLVFLCFTQHSESDLYSVIMWFYFLCRLYAYEVDKSCDMNENLGAGIAVFQGLSNIALNCECVSLN